MSAIELNLQPTDRQLRQFGLLALVALPLAGWFLTGKPMGHSWESHHTTTIGSLAAIGAMLAVTAIVRPAMLKWIFIAACVAAFPIGFVIGELIMLAIFLIGFVPMAMLFRLVGRDALHRGCDPQSTSYWELKEPAKDPTTYYRQS